jgi:lipoprotein-releasing system ATP-binding protein
MEETILTAEDIHKTFKTNQKSTLEVLKGISLEIIRNKITVIVGASGAGKSTLLHILSGLDRPDKGSVNINNLNIFKFSEDKLAAFRNKHIGFVFQFHYLLPEFSALENVAIPLMINSQNQRQAFAKSKELLESIGLGDRIDHKPAELSGGEQQRIAVARSLVNDPEIIFADEPTGNLDSQNSNSVHQMFIDLRDNYNKTFVIVTHNPELVKLSDIVYEMKDGNLKV